MDEHVIKTYRRAEPVFVRGQGACLYTDQGREYLDFLGGIAVSALGHGHPKLVEALQDQVGKVLHVSNLLRHPYTEEVAERVTRLAGMAEVFFCNSGTEANEAALKIARKHHFAKGTGRTGFVALEGSFHGRTMGALSVTHNRAYREPFAPLCGEVTFVAPGDADALRRALARQPAALILEPIQGETGVHELPHEFLRLARELCTETGTILIHDEVQCGSGRTGTFLCAQQAGVTPDIVTLAKPIAGGLPMGMTLIGETLSGTLQPGDHGSTFAGGPLACRGALVLLRELEEGGLQQRIRELGAHLTTALDGLVALSEHVVERRGRGLMQAVQLDPSLDAREVQRQLFTMGLIVNATGPDTLRILPPFVVTQAQVFRAADLIRTAVDQLTAQAPQR
ncbi:MAG: acetylornithine/succinylornithine family transaminase [Planctomycetes bacterium]|nr:acetylornithine/succinylornithine family transaminase [Planctomycetota bacterium]MCB9870873.1 acetylornithine/succinylornithine family transaminase [Planctomycetota bacterium]